MKLFFNTQTAVVFYSKKIITLFFLSFLIVSTALSQIRVTTNGYVGVNNNSPSYGFDVNSGTIRFHNWVDLMFDWSGLGGGAEIYPLSNWYMQLGKPNQQISTIYTYGIRVYGIWVTSDDSIKTNKRPITNALGIIQQLNGHQYNYTTAFINTIPDSAGAQTDYLKNQYGFMAREVMQVIPEIVSYDSVSGRYSVNYTEVIPILNEAIKAQQLSIDSLRNITNMQQALNATMQASIVSLQNCCNPPAAPIMSNPTGNKQQTMDKMQSATLYQNNPNPFDVRTEIKYYLPPTASNATIVIYNLSGQQLQSFPNLHSTGTQSIIIDGGNLSAGSYYYTLLVDGTEVDTKKMILFK